MIQLFPAPFSPYEELNQFQAQASTLEPGRFGATAVFVGSMRDFNEGNDVKGMFLDHYPGMTEKQLTSIIDEAKAEWPILEALILHRVGQIEPAEPIVLTAVWSAHRAAAFEANRFLMEALKSRAPFWKQETLREGGQRWVEKNTPG